MSLRNALTISEYGNALGLDTASPISMVKPGFVRDATNMDLTLLGGYKKRKGYTAQTPNFGSEKVVGVHEYRDLAGNLTPIFFARTKASKLSSGSFTDIKTGLSDARPAFVQIGDRLISFNGKDSPWIWEGGASTRSLGLTKPSSAPVAALGGGSGSLTNGGTYLWVYTYAIRRSGQLIAESSPSSASNQLTMDASGDASITIAAASDPNVTNIRIYRTVAGGSVFFLEDEIAASSTSYTSTKSDEEVAGSGIQLELDNGRLSDYSNFTTAHFPLIARNRLFVVSNDRLQIRYSKIGQEGALPESFEASKIVDAIGRRGLSDKIVGLGSIKNVPIVLKQFSVGRLEEVGVTDLTGAGDNVLYIYRELSDNVTAISHWAQTQVFDELIFLGRDNVYATTGQSVRPIANQIQDIIRSMDLRESKLEDLSMVNDEINRRIYISIYRDISRSYPNFILVGDYQQYPNFRWTVYDQGPNSTTHPGLRVGSFFKLTNASNGAKEVYFGSFDGSGKWYKMNQGDSDDGSNIYARLASRPYSAGNPAIDKLWKNVRVYAEASSSAYTFDFCTTYDLQNSEERCETFSVPSSSALWDSAYWDQDNWAGELLAELEYDPHRKAKWMQFVFKQEGKDAPVSILGWAVSASAIGLKP